MGTVLREGGYRVAIPVDDHDPSHVHVIGDGEAKINITDVSVIWAVGFKKSDIKKILRIVADNQSLLLEEWGKLHG